MWKDLPKSLISAVSAINQQSRQAFAEEQAAQKKPKLPGVPAPKADPAAHAGAADMAKKNMKEGAEHTVPKTAKEKSLAKLAPPTDKITHADVMVGRGVKKEEVEGVEEGWDEMMKAAKERRGPQPNGGSGVKQGTRYGGGKQKDEKEKKEVKESLTSKAQKLVKTTGDVAGAAGTIAGGVLGGTAKTVGAARQTLPATGVAYNKGRAAAQKAVAEENTDTPGNSAHQCAIHVKSEQFGEGRTLFSQHAEPDAEGNIAWYDVMFAEGIKRVETKDIEIVVSESHMNHKKKK